MSRFDIERQAWTHNCLNRNKPAPQLRTNAFGRPNMSDVKLCIPVGPSQETHGIHQFFFTIVRISTGYRVEGTESNFLGGALRVRP